MTSPTLTADLLRKIAEIDTSGLSADQRLDVISRSIGVSEVADLGAGTEQEAQADKLFKAVVIWNPEFRCAYANNMQVDELEDAPNWSVVSYDTQAELDAFLEGVDQAQGWSEPRIVERGLADHRKPFLQALAKDPELSLVDWHNAKVAEMEAEEYDDEDDGFEPN